MKKMILVLMAVLMMLGCEEKTQELQYSQIEEMAFEDDFEPSGIAYCNGELYVVSDEGTFFVFKGSRGKYYTVKQEADYEGVTCKENRIYLAEEGKDNIIQISKTGQILNEYKIDRKFNGKKVISKKGDGLEAIAYYKEDPNYIYFIVANQSDKFEGKDKSAIFYVRVDKKTNEAKITDYYPMKINDIAALYYEDELVYFVSDDRDTLYISDEKMNIKKRYKLPGKAQEGIAIDKVNKVMYIADDKGYVIKLKLGDYPLVKDKR